MAFDVSLFFDDFVKYLQNRSEAVKALAVMAANEHWYKFEAAALIAQDRTRYGIDGTDGDKPAWWVTCVSRGVLSDPHESGQADPGRVRPNGSS